MRAALGAVSDRTINRTIIGLGLALVIGLPTVGLLYVFDRHVDPGLPMTQRTIAAAEAAIRSEPNKLSNRLQLGAAYAAGGRLRDAVAQYAEVIQVEPGNRIALLGRADGLVALGDLDAAARDYQAVVDVAKGTEMAKVDPQLEAAYFGLGSIALQQDRPRDAATQLANALTINRTDADALNLMGTALLRIDDAKGAIEALRDAIALVPVGWCEPYTQLVDAYTAVNDATGTQYATGMVALCQKRPAEADRLLEPLENGPFARDALIGLALTAEDRGDRDAAVAFYFRVYSTDPTDFQAITGLNRLGAGASPGLEVAPGSSTGDRAQGD